MCISNTPPPAGLAGMLFAIERDRERKDRLLEGQIAKWELPASDSEQALITRAAAMVREALAKSQWLRSEQVRIEPQGSYYNNTNVRRQSDMDVRVVHPNIEVLPAENLSRIQVDEALGYKYSGRPLQTVAADLREAVHASLAAHFGYKNVNAGKRAFRVSAVQGSRCDIDVVPALTLHYVYDVSRTILGYPNLRTSEGIVIVGTDGRRIYNFPQLHYENGVAKRAATTLRFKKVVRSLKRLRDIMVEEGEVSPDVAPSFLIESLVYNVEDEHFLNDEPRAARLRRVLNRCAVLLSRSELQSSLVEINGIKRLFALDQPWTVADAILFTNAAYKRLAS